MIHVKRLFYLPVPWLQMHSIDPGYSDRWVIQRFNAVETFTQSLGYGERTNPSTVEFSSHPLFCVKSFLRTKAPTE